jgi:5,10-methylenetetrahydromethanopterin reductase
LSSDIAVSLWAGAGHQTVADVVGAVQGAADAGWSGIWLPQTLSFDALTALAVVAHDVPDIHLGTAVVPIQGRHPIPLSQQALTVAQVAGPGRFTLGIGVTHAMLSEGFYGIPYSSVVELCREELLALGGLLGPEHRTNQVGDHLTARGSLMVEAPTPGLVVAALGPKMLELAGSLSDGTVTWMTGPKSLRERIVPAITAAAERAGRASPRVIAGLPVCVTEDVDAAREAVRPRLEGAGALPSYRRMLAGEGLDDLTDLAIIGSPDEVSARLLELAESGVTELMADVFGSPEERAATAAVLTAAVSSETSRRWPLSNRPEKPPASGPAQGRLPGYRSWRKWCPARRRRGSEAWRKPPGRYARGRA